MLFLYIGQHYELKYSIVLETMEKNRDEPMETNADDLMLSFRYKKHGAIFIIPSFRKYKHIEARARVGLLTE